MYQITQSFILIANEGIHQLIFTDCDKLIDSVTVLKVFKQLISAQWLGNKGTMYESTSKSIS